MYSASGQKPRTIAFGLNTATTDYIGAFVYKNGTLSYINLPEGRLLPSGSTFAYEYHLRDHLGNTRATYTPTTNGNSRLTQYTNYYPFGLPIQRTDY